MAKAPPPEAPLGAPSLPGRFDELESLRGIAALLVVFFHLRQWHPALDFNLIENGYLMVELFFVLSGFVIYNAYGNAIDSRRALVRFQFLRFGRLYPVHLLFLAGFVGIECLKLLAPQGFALTSPPFSDNGGAALVQQLLLVQALGPTGHEMSFNGPAWSISVEFYTYLLFGLVVLLAGRFKLPVFAAIAIGAFVLLFGLDISGFKLLLNCLIGFFVGCLLREWLARSEFTLPALALPVAFIGLIACLAIKPPQSHDWLIFVFSPLLIVALLRARGSWLARAMLARPLIWLGSLSYAIYMSHVFIISVFSLAIKRGFKVPEVVSANGTLVFDWPASIATLVVLAALGAVLGVSQIVYAWVEMPLRQWSREVAAKRLGTVRAGPGEEATRR